MLSILILPLKNQFIKHINEKYQVNKYLICASTNKNKEVVKKYTEFWGEIKNLIEKLHGRLGEYEKDFIKTKLNSDDNLPLNKTLKLHNLTAIVRSVFQDDGKYHPQVLLGECLYDV